MELLYSNNDLKLNLYKRNTTIISTSDSELLFILNALRNRGYDYVSIYTPFSTDTVMKELSIFSESDTLLNEFQCKYLENKAIKDLAMDEVALVKIIIELSKNKDCLVLYDVLTYLDKEIKDKVINYIKKQNVTFINITSNEEEYLINEYMIVLNNRIVALEGETLLVLEQEKILKRLGFSLPFMIDISLQLKAYGLIDKVFINYKELVGELWKNKN